LSAIKANRSRALLIVHQLDKLAVTDRTP